jgi:shikimate dehydrogenase
MTARGTEAPFGHGESLQVGLIGSGIGSSRTPALHMREGREAGLAYSYVLMDLDEQPGGPATLEQLLSQAERAGFRGLNITHPCKQAVLELLDEADEDVRVIGACNTIVFENGRRVGHNTDAWGFAESFRKTFAAAPIRNVVQLGAGGAGAAVAFALLSLGVERLEIYDIDPLRAQGLVDRYGPVFGPGRIATGSGLTSALARADGLVQTSPIGSLGHPGMPVEPDLLTARPWLLDIIYFPLETQLVLAARQRGCQATGGGSMAVYQAVRAFEFFTGIPANAPRMAAHFADMTSSAG